VLLDGRLGGWLAAALAGRITGALGACDLQALYIGGDVERLDIDERSDFAAITPGEEVRDRPEVGLPGVLVADGGGKELQEAAHGGVAGAGNHRRHGQAAAPMARCRGCPGTPNRDDLIHGWV
jgi:hypothetical protein